MAVETNSSSKLMSPRAGGAAAYEWARATVKQGWSLSRRHRISSLAILAVLLAGLGYLIFTSGEAGPADYTMAVVARGNIEDTVTALGNLQPLNYVDVGAQVSGQLKTLYVKLGDHVKKGQLLAEIDARVQEAKVQTDRSNLANLQAQLADKRSQLALAQANFRRQQGLMSANATSQNDFDSAKQAAQSGLAGVKALQAQITAAKSQLEGDQVTLGYTKIYSPMDGTVVSLAAKEGQTLNANMSAPVLMRIADLSTMEVDTQVSEADVPKLKIGMPAYFTTLGQPNKRWYGKLSQIQPTPQVVNNVVLYTATFNVNNPDDELMAQMTAQVFFVTASAKDVLVVPVAALHPLTGAADTATEQAGNGGREMAADDSSRVTRTGAPGANGGSRRSRRNRSASGTDAKLPAGARREWILVIAPNGSIHRRIVAVGVSNRVSAEVVSGLKAGERIVVGTTAGSTDSIQSDRQRRPRFRRFGGI